MTNKATTAATTFTVLSRASDKTAAELVYLYATNFRTKIKRLATAEIQAARLRILSEEIGSETLIRAFS
ncbi:hypothetical protein D3C87_1886540 [compost metagenome]